MYHDYVIIEVAQQLESASGSDDETSKFSVMTLALYYIFDI